MSYIGNKPTAKNVGVFTPNQQYNAIRSGDWTRSDPNWNSVVLLLQPFAGDTSIEDLSQSAHSITNNGVSLDSTNEKWTDQPSMLFESSNNDYLSIADSDDWHYAGSDFTIEGFVLSNIGNGDAGALVSQLSSGSSFYSLRINNNGDKGIEFSSTDISGPAENSDRTWSGFKHVALTRDGNTFRIFFDGTQTVTSTDSGSISNISAPLQIGIQGGSFTAQFDGNMTSLRITKGVARYTSNFTPPTRPFPTR
jgi:hypothetical protein